MFTETPHLILRDLTRNDFAAMHAISSDAKVQQMMEGYLPAGEADLREWLAGTIHHNEQTPRLSHNCAIVLKDTDQVIGWIGFGVPSDTRKGDIDFGYAMHTAYRNHGYMTEAVNAMLAYCFDVVGACTITASHFEFNPASGRVMQKAGMWMDEKLTREMANGEVYYSITVDAWRNKT